MIFTITAKQAREIAIREIPAKEKFWLDEIMSLIEDEANRGGFRLVYSAEGFTESGQRFLSRELQNLGFSVGFNRGEFTIDW